MLVRLVGGAGSVPVVKEVYARGGDSPQRAQTTQRREKAVGRKTVKARTLEKRPPRLRVNKGAAPA
jgi:hypothetical protein